MSHEEDRRVIRDHYSSIAWAYAKHELDRGRTYTQPLVEELPIEDAERLHDIGTGPRHNAQADEVKGDFGRSPVAFSIDHFGSDGSPSKYSNNG